MVLTVVSMVAVAWNSPPRVVKPAGFQAMEDAEQADLDQWLFQLYRRSGESTVEWVSTDSDTPPPAASRQYRDLIDNLLLSLKYYYKLNDEYAPSEFVSSWSAGTGERIVSNARLLSLETHVNYLLTLEMYRKVHSKAVFDNDLEYARQKVDDIFSEEWHTQFSWPLATYFDLMDLYEITGEEKYLEYAERYGAASDRTDPNSPYAFALEQSFKIYSDIPRTVTPFNFYHAALLADYGARYDDLPLQTQAKSMFDGIRDQLYDPRYKMLWKQASVSTPGSSTANYTRTFDALEQFNAIRGIVEYYKVTGDPDAISLARALVEGIWGLGSKMLIHPPQGLSEGTFYGLYTAYDVEREAERLDQNEQTIVQILLYDAMVLVNEVTRGELRDSIDFLVSWLETNGPVYRPEANGYLATYDEVWEVPEDPRVSGNAAIWMSKAIARDEWYRMQRAAGIAIEAASN